ncbi:hypothetical protein TNCV_3340451 [Trichonephila clavipes]|nr:hypothetical protein TNCV_3340451 [Trichonephila clavipes]
MKITPLKVLRIDADKTLRLSVAFQFTECPGTGLQKVSVGVGKRENLAHSVTVVRVHYFVRGGFVGHRSRVSSKHLSSLIFRSTVFDSSGVKKGLRCSCKMLVWVSCPPKISTAAGSGYVTALALSYRTFPLRKV